MAIDHILRGLSSVKQRMERACRTAGRASESVRLLAVSKGQGADAIRAAYELGQRDFGENYVQEWVSKRESLRDLEQIRWHFIGHLQRNKAKEVCRREVTLQSVDSLRLMEALAKHVGSLDFRLPIFFQVNVSDEPQKSGCRPEDLPDMKEAAASHDCFSLLGLMTVPKASQDPESSRIWFRKLRKLAEQLEVVELSMGMSHDLEIAIEEGATVVRVGTDIFGQRPTKAPL